MKSITAFFRTSNDTIINYESYHIESTVTMTKSNKICNAKETSHV